MPRADGPVPNGALLEAFRHHAWAARRLLEFCRDLPADRLHAPGAGTYGSVLETLNHIVLSDARYLRRLAGSGPGWVDAAGGSDPGDVDPATIDLDLLRSRAEETGRLWERLLSGPFDAERVVLLDRGAYRARAGVLVTQALHHGTAHREQVCAILTRAGIEPPDLQAWAYAEATGRGGPRDPSG